MKPVIQNYEMFFKWAILENGHSIDATGLDLKIGDSWMTQWGPRKVVELVSEVFDTRPTEPYGV